MRLRTTLVPFGATIVAMAAFQSGASVAKGLFHDIGPQGAASLRLLFGSAILFGFTRPWRSWPPRGAWPTIVMLGVCMASAILFFYMALSRLPQGVCIALQFLGPLGVALLGSRRLRDLTWALLAALGVWALLSAKIGGRLDLAGVAFALLAAAGWAGYILLGRHVTKFKAGSAVAPLAMAVAAGLMLPIGLLHAGAALFAPAHLPLALEVGILAAAVPFPLELFAIARLPTQVFAVLMSLEPAFGALSGLVLLGETLTPIQVGGVAAVVLAAVGSTWTSKSDDPDDPIAADATFTLTKPD